MNTDLRPLSLGEILDRTFQLYRANFLMFAGIATLAAGLDLAWKLIQTGLVRFLVHHVSAASLAVSNSGMTLVNLAVYTVATAVVLAAINRAVSAIYLGQTTSIAQALGEVKGHWFRYVWLYVVAFLSAWGAVTAGFIVVIFLTAFAGRAGGASSVIFMGVFGLSMFLLIPFGVWMMLRYSLANSACVFEDLGIRASLKRSIFLSQGSRGKIFVMFLLAGVLIMVVSGAASLPIIVSAFKHPEHAGQVSLFMTIYLLVTGFVITSLTTPIYGIGLTLFYYDARIRKEGFDIEWMMRWATPVELPDAVVLIPPTEASLG
jgi:hypothetical protein